MSLKDVDIVCMSGHAAPINQKLIRDGFITRKARYPDFSNRSSDFDASMQPMALFLGHSIVRSLDAGDISRLSSWARSHRDLKCVLLGQPPVKFESVADVPVLQRFTIAASGL
jgi:hypothetical protein